MTSIEGLASTLNNKAETTLVVAKAEAEAAIREEKDEQLQAQIDNISAPSQSDWKEDDDTADSYILNKPANATQSAAGLMSSTDKTKLDGIATGAEVNVQPDWSQATTTADDYIKNKPTIPTVNNATLTIKQNGVQKGTFTANAASAVTIELTDTEGMPENKYSTQNVSTSPYSLHRFGAMNTDGVEYDVLEISFGATAGHYIMYITNPPSQLGAVSRMVFNVGYGQTVDLSFKFSAIIKNGDLFLPQGIHVVTLIKASVNIVNIDVLLSPPKWLQATMPSLQSWSSVTYGNGMFVSISYESDIAICSIDGINWSQAIMASSQKWRGITYSKGMFVAVAEHSDIAEYSTDGVNWSQTPMPSSQSWGSVTYGNGMFVAVARPSDVMSYSTDGINWVQGTMPSRQNWSSVTYGNGMFVAVVFGPDVVGYSTDGINWAQGTMPRAQSWRSVAYGNGMFVAVGGSSSGGSDVGAYSTDGINWTQMTMPSLQGWNGVTYGNGKFVAVANITGIAAYSVG
jgi:hypothetical protein